MGEQGTPPILPDSKILEILFQLESTTEIVIANSRTESGSAKGENYNGVLLSCDVTAKIRGEDEVKDYHWMVKLPAKDPQTNYTNKLMRSEEKEAIMYAEVIPRWRSMVKDTDLELNLCPVHHAEFDDKGSMLVMENLKKAGYRDAADKKKGLSLANAKLALTELGKFHALGYAYMKGYPGGIPEGLEKNQTLANDFFMGNPDEKLKAIFDRMKEGTMMGLLHILGAVQEQGQDFAGIFRRFHKMERNVFDYRDELYRPDESEFNTLCHGDCWFNNALFKEDGSGCCLIDLAMPRWGNPCTDLAYFFFLSVSPQLRRTHLEEMLGHYHDQLVRSLHALGEDPAVYPFRTLLKDYHKYSFLGFIMSLWILPFLLCTKEDSLNPSVEEGEEEWSNNDKMKELMTNKEVMDNLMRREPHLKSVLAGNVMEMVDRGLFKNVN